MRVANKTLYDGAIRSLAQTSSAMVDANEVATTGKKINNLSDDPSSLVTVLGLKSSISNIQQMNRNVSMGTSWLNSSESALTQVNNVITAAKQLTITMSSGNASASERNNSVGQVQSYLEQIISLANSSMDGKYIFSGTNTGTAPFKLNDTGTAVTYTGNDTPFSIQIGKDTTVEVGKDGEDIFGKSGDASNIFQTLINLKTSLQNNDVKGIQDAMGNLDNRFNSINGSISEIGGKNTGLGVKKSIIDDLNLNYTDRISSLEDADMANAIINLQSKQLAYNAALASTAKIMQTSLLDYLS